MSVVPFSSGLPHHRVALREFCSLLGGDPSALAAQLGVKVYETELDPDVDSCLLQDPISGGTSGYKVMLNLRASLAQKKVALAQELGRFVLTRDRQGSLPVGNAHQAEPMGSKNNRSDTACVRRIKEAS